MTRLPLERVKEKDEREIKGLPACQLVYSIPLYRLPIETSMRRLLSMLTIGNKQSYTLIRKSRFSVVFK
jgi:hypothetical protein